MANLTSKELTAIEEQLGAESVLIAKYKQLANTTEDPALSNSLNQIAQKHQNHFDTLYQFLN